jgi:hypothetical protein
MSQVRNVTQEELLGVLHSAISAVIVENLQDLTADIASEVVRRLRRVQIREDAASDETVITEVRLQVRHRIQWQGGGE